MTGDSPPLSSPDIDASIKDWKSVKSPGSSVSDALTNISSAPTVQKGMRVKKVSSNGKLKNRMLTVVNDKNAVLITRHKVPGDGSSKPVLSTIAKSVANVLRLGTSAKKNEDVRYFDVADISDIQVGLLGTKKLEAVTALLGKKPEQVVTIVHHGDRKRDLVLADKVARDAFLKCAKEMMSTYRIAMTNVGNEELLLRYIWYDVDVNKDGFISIKEFSKVLRRINLSVKDANKIYNDYRKELGISGCLSYHQIMCLVQRIKVGKYNNKKVTIPSEEIWNSVFGPETTHVSADDFLRKFLIEKQNETNVTVDDVAALFEHLNSMELNREHNDVRVGYINRTRFETYLHHERNDAYNPESQKLDTSTLDQPISRYWINTSHNTYLSGDQLRSASSVECYMDSLRRGCKCLELDCWDGDSCIPVVYHGHTLTSKILFADIVQGVKCYVESHPDTYPIILSLENHCSYPVQSEMAKILRETLGEVLWSPKETEINNNKELPSPSSLRGKVIIKGKRPPEPDDISPENETEYDPADADSDTADGKELRDMTLFHGTKFKSFELSKINPSSHMHSIGESKIGKILNKKKSNAELWRSYNIQHMTRTYPAGTRVDSSNYNPVLAWSMGCQLVALNFQTCDQPLLLNDGRFRENGNCGYVLKPRSIVCAALVPNLSAFKVRILCGSCLPKPNGAKEGEFIDPYVMVSVHDVKAEDGIEQYVTDSFYTETICNNGFCPVWNQINFKEFALHTPDAAMIQFTLMESDYGIDKRLAVGTIPFSCLRKGYRSIQLFDQNNTRTGHFGLATVLVEIDY